MRRREGWKEEGRRREGGGKEEGRRRGEEEKYPMNHGAAPWLGFHFVTA